MCKTGKTAELHDRLGAKLKNLGDLPGHFVKSFSEGSSAYVDHIEFGKRTDKGYKILEAYFSSKSREFKKKYNKKTKGVSAPVEKFAKLINADLQKKEITYEEIVGISKEIFDKEEFYNVVHSYYGEELPDWFQEELNEGMIAAGFAADKFKNLNNKQARENLTDYFFKWSGGFMGKVQNKIEDIVLYGMQEGKSMDKIANDITTQIKGIGKERAFLIAQTETIRVSGEISIGTYKGIGIKKYNILPALNACPVCKAKASQNPYLIDDRSGMPPVHPRCRCSTTAEEE